MASSNKVNPLVLSYPDFTLGSVIDPEEFDQNNLDLQDKTNEIVAVINNNIDEIVRVEGDLQGQINIDVLALLAHKTSADHDGRYFTETEVNAIKDALQLQINLNGSQIVTLQNELSALDNTFSTDAERVQAIVDVINQFQIADDDLETLIVNKADKTSVYTKAEIDNMTLGAYKFGFFKNSVIVTEDNEVVSIGIPEWNPETDPLMIYVGGLYQTVDVDYTINTVNKTITGEWLADYVIDFFVVKNVRVVSPEDYIDGFLLLADSVQRSALSPAVRSELDGLRNDVDINASDIEASLGILQKFNPTTGTATALEVDTLGTFDLTLDGNILNINPNVTNTGAMTINPDGQGAKSIKKFDIGTDAYVDLEAEDIKKNTPLSLKWDLANGFFVLAPKGANPLSVWKKPTLVTTQQLSSATTVDRISVSGSGWIISISSNNTVNDQIKLIVDGLYVFGNSTQALTVNAGKFNLLLIRYEIGFTFSTVNNYASIFYCIGENYEKSNLLVYTNANTGTANLTSTSVTGKGWLYSIMYNGSETYNTLIVDDNIKYTNRTVHVNSPILIRFESGFTIKTSNLTYTPIIIYTLD